MKKTIVFLLAILMLLNVGGCAKEKLNVNPDVIEEINTNYPSAEIIEENDGLGVIVNDIEYTSDISMSSAGSVDGPAYATIDDLIEKMNMITHTVVKAIPTGVSKQYMSVNENTGFIDWYHTETEVEVTDVLYGTVNVGDKLICQEWYAVFVDENGQKSAISLKDRDPLAKNKEYLLVLTTSGNESGLFEGRTLYGIAVNSINLESPSTETQLGAQIYEKYIVNRDIAIDEQEEIRKATEWKETLKERGVDVSETLTENELAMIGKAADKCGRIGTKTEHETK